MKKIVLIDDNLFDYRNNHGASFVDDGVYSDILVNVSQINADYDFSTLLSDASCILIHASTCDFVGNKYQSSSHEGVIIVIEDYSDFGINIPLVKFSDGDSEFFDIPEDWDGRYIDHINKEVFYSRLKPFLDHYRNSGVIDFMIIAEGPDYIKETARRYCLSIISILSRFNGDMNDNVIDAICGEELAGLVKISNPQLGIEYESFVSYLEDNSITVENLKSALQKINRSFNQYGRNIYPWTSLAPISD